MGHNTIEINGQRYDALSGKVLNSQQTAPAPAKVHKSANNGQILDGFIRRPQRAHHKPAAPSRAIHAKTSRSKTLMRGAVKKPVKGVSPQPSKNYTVYQPPSKESFKRARVANVDHVRAGRAAVVPRSSLISRFGDARNNITKRVAPIAVKPVPKHANYTPHAVSAPIDSQTKGQNIPELDGTFSRALKNAVSHKLPKTKQQSVSHRVARKLRISPRSLNVAVGIFISLFLGGLVAYQHIPQLAIQMASTRAGVRAQLPSYKPSGFSLKGPVQYSSGIVTLNYASNSDDRNFQIVQESSDWTSQSLLENLVEAKESYQTFQDKGRTVYIYEDSNAAWVNGGVLYKIEGKSHLNSDQLRRIISGL